MRKIAVLFFGVVVTIFACNEEIAYEERDKILEKAYTEISSNDENRIIKGLRTIKKYPTSPGLDKIISLWEKEISKKVEDEILNTLAKFELFVRDPSKIEEIFKRNYTVNSPKSEKLKLIRLIKSTDVKIKDSLIKEIESEM